MVLGWSREGGRDCLVVQGWRFGSCDARRVGVAPSEVAGAAQPMAGAFALDGDVLRFTPRHPFVGGVSYSLMVDGVEVGRIVGALPAAAASATTASAEVVAIHPSGGEVPLNLLRIYVHFSAAMSEGWAARAVRVRRADTGEALEGTFLHMEPELWDSEHRRLTLLLDPGRIKRGLLPQREAGYPLVQGVPVVVEVAPLFRDAHGQPLRVGAARGYAVGAPVRMRVDPSLWRWDVPAAGSVEPLRLGFDRPLDHALVGRCLRVVDASGDRVEGIVSVGDGEASWSFRPRVAWDAAPMTLVVDATLEDVAGNSVARVFDRDLEDRADDPLDVRRLSYAHNSYRCTKHPKPSKASASSTSPRAWRAPSPP
jgi:hypothetical protein